MRQLIHIAFALALAFVTSSASLAGNLPVPVGKIILTIKGEIEHTNRNGQAEFDRKLLENLDQSTLQTSTPWTDGPQQFEGTSGKKLLEAVGAQGQWVEAIALNDYKITIPINDFYSYPLLFATRMNGKQLRVRDKGPVWIVYPQDDYPELKRAEIHKNWAWQLKELIIK